MLYWYHGADLFQIICGGTTMNQISNQSVAVLADIVCKQLKENGFAASAIDRANRYAGYLSAFMEENSLPMYEESVGSRFLDTLSPRFSIETNKTLKLFIARMNAVLNGEDFVTHVQMRELTVLPPSLEKLLVHYEEHCVAKGLHLSTIHEYESKCRKFLSCLADIGVNDKSSITVSTISKAFLRQPSSSDFAAIRTFLRFLFKAEYLEKDYSFLIPYFKHPQPVPSVYSVKEVQEIEEKIGSNTPFGKRNYAMLLLATRLGIRAGDIVTMTFDELDFQSETIRIIQNKTGVQLELPMLPCVRDALRDYIQNYRGPSASEYVFLSLHPPFTALKVSAFGKYMREALKDTEINIGTRKSGPHAMRASLASSMINDSIPYEVVRRTLGHTSANAIKNYARLDIEQLKLYTLAPPEPSGHFAEYLSGRRYTK